MAWKMVAGMSVGIASMFVTRWELGIAIGGLTVLGLYILFDKLEWGTRAEAGKSR